MGSRALTLLVVTIGVQLCAAGGIAAATADEPSPAAAEPSVTDQLAAEGAPPPVAAPAPAPDRPAGSGASQTGAPGAGASQASVTVSRAGSSSLRTVSVVDFAFEPAALKVKLGDTVQWINNGTVEEGHNVIGDGLQSPVLHTGESYSFTFTEAGTISYVCTIHPKMTGTIEVVDPNAGDAGSAKKPKSGKRGASTAGSGGTSGSAGSSASTASASGAGSESAAGRSASAAGTDGSLPSTGSDSLGLTIAGLALLGFGLGLRRCGLRWRS